MAGSTRDHVGLRPHGLRRSVTRRRRAGSGRALPAESRRDLRRQRRIDMSRGGQRRRNRMARGARDRAAESRGSIEVRAVCSHAERYRRGVAREIARWRRRGRIAMTPAAAITRADLDGAVDVRRGCGMAGRAVALRVTRWRRGVTAHAGPRRSRRCPHGSRRATAARVQRVAVAVHVRARAVRERRRTLAITRHGRERRARAERDLRRCDVVDDVSGRIPAIGDHVALRARRVRRAMLRVRTRRRTIAMTRRACRRSLGVTRRARDLRRAAAEIRAVAGRAQREVPIATRELFPVKVLAGLVEESRRMHAAAIGTRRSEVPLLGAADATHDHHHHPPHGIPWNFSTSASFPGPWHVAQDSTPSIVVLTWACAAVYG